MLIGVGVGTVLSGVGVNGLGVGTTSSARTVTSPVSGCWAMVTSSTRGAGVAVMTISTGGGTL
jgi:hypothetical protein